MNDKKFYKIEGDPEEISWLLTSSGELEPYCSKHTIPLWGNYHDRDLTCPHDNAVYRLKHTLGGHVEYVRSMINRENLTKLKTVRIDPEGFTVLARERIDKDPAYFIDAKLSDTSKGLQLMIQAGKRDENGKKVQIFVEPPTERIGFDHNQKDRHPAGIFAKVTATFKKSKSTIEKN